MIYCPVHFLFFLFLLKQTASPTRARRRSCVERCLLLHCPASGADPSLHWLQHFLQVWVQPTTPSLSPTYYSRAFPASAKLNTPCLIVAPADDPAVTPTRTGAPPGERPAATPAPVHAAFCAHACVQAPGTTLSFTLKGMTRLAYLHLCMRGGYRAPGEPALARDKSGVLRVEVGGGGGECVADEGDGVFVRVGKGGGGRKLRVTNEGGKEAEWVVMEVE